MGGGNKTVKPKAFDPLFPGAGGHPLRANIFERLGGIYDPDTKTWSGPSLMDTSSADAQRAALAGQNAAASFGPLQNYARNSLSGQYLNQSPHLNKAMANSRSQTQDALRATRTASDVASRGQYDTARGSLSDQQRRLQSKFARTGQTFGTGMSQAQDSSNVSLNAQIARNEASRQAQLAANENQIMANLSDRHLALEAARLNQERQLQQQASSIYEASQARPFEILSAIPSMRYAGLNDASNLVGGLAGDGKVMVPGTYYKPGVGDHMLQAMAIQKAWN